MSVNAASSFETKWWMEVTEALQRDGSLLESTVTVVNNVASEIYKFPTAGSFTSQKNKARHALLIANNTAHGSADATLDDYHASDLISDLDQFKTSVDFRNIYTRGIVKSLGRDKDTEILSALAAGATGANTTNSDATATMSVDLVAEAVAILKTNDVDFNNDDVVMVITPEIERKIQGVSALTSGDFTRGVMSIENGVVARLMGMKVIVHSSRDLITSSTLHLARCYPKEAIGLAVGRDIRTKVSYLADRDSWQAMGNTSFGAISKQDDAIVSLKVTV